MTGIVKMVASDRRYAFVRADDGSDFYVRKGDVRDLNKGDRVQFRTASFSDGRTLALDIERISDGADSALAAGGNDGNEAQG